MFSEGFDPSEVAKLQEEDRKVNGLLCPCIRDQEKLQLNCVDETGLTEQSTKLGVEDSVLQRLLKVDRKHRLKGDKLWDVLQSLEPGVKDLWEQWKTLRLGHMTLTSVGIAIGHANVRRITGEEAPLGIWIK